MDLPPEYNKIFDKKLIIITGVARSGTTLLGKIVGSFSNAHYCFEPHTFILIPPLIQKGYLSEKQGSELLKALLFEELFLQILHGRYVNFNKNEDSYIGNYIDPEAIKLRWKNYKRRKDIIEYLKNYDYLFILKIPNIQPILETVKKIFKGVKLIHVIRDGNDVVSSSVRRDFYSRDYLNKRSIDWSEEINSLKEPWFIDKKNQGLFFKWNYYTRAAYIWRILTEMGLKFADHNKTNVLQLKHEDFIKNPIFLLGKIEEFSGQNRTHISMRHIETIKSYKQREYPDNTTNIELPEREKFVKLRKKLGYIKL